MADDADVPSFNDKCYMAKLEVLKEIIRNEISITCSHDIISVCEKYYKAMEDLITICHTDPHFSHIICGTGLNNIPPLFHIQETETPNLLCLAQPPPVQKILFVHQHSVILQDTQVLWKRKCPLVFYLSGLPCSQEDHVKIFLSSRTHENMMKGSFGISFSENSTVIHKDEHDTVKFFLSSKTFQEEFNEKTPNFLCNYRPVIGVIDKKRGRDPNYQRETSDGEEASLSQPSEMYAFKTIPALFHPEWPPNAFSFLSRERPSGWPSHNLCQSVISGGCHVIPSPTCSSEETSNEWQLNFDVAEKGLFDTLTSVDKQAAFLFQCMVRDRRSLNRRVITVDHIKTTILWTLEMEVLAEESNDRLFVRFMQFWKRFHSFLACGKCSHYFIPQRNLFDGISIQVLEDIKDVVESLLEQPWTCVLHCHLLPYAFYDRKNQIESVFFSEKQVMKEDQVKALLDDFKVWSVNISEALIGQFRFSLLNTFHETVILYILTSVAKINSYTINESIILLKDTLRIIQDSSAENELYMPYIDVVCINLATLYHVKALTVSGKRERDYFLIKSEAMMRESKKMDLCLGRSRLATLLFSMNRFPEAAKELEELLAIIDEHIKEDTSSSNSSDKIKEEGKDTDNFSEMLWEKWLKREYAIEVFYNRTLQPICPSAMNRTMSLTMCNTLGIQRHSVAVFSPIFYGRFLLALCHTGMRDYDQALPILQGLEAVLCDQEMVNTLEMSAYSEVNEKRIVAYYIVLGNCYIALNEPKRAKDVYLKAMKMYPTPRNPAAVQYLNVKYGDTISGIQQGTKALVLASTLSLVYAYVSSQI